MSHTDDKTTTTRTPSTDGRLSPSPRLGTWITSAKLLTLFIFLLLLPILAGSLWVEFAQLRQAQTDASSDASHFASAYANQIASRLNIQFTTLDFVASTLLGTTADPGKPSPDVERIMRRFIILHPNLYAFNIQSADGDTILWSTQKQSPKPINSGTLFTPLPMNPDFLLGQSKLATRIGTHVLPMRFRVKDAAGKTRYFVGSPYLLDRLLTDDQTQLPQAFRFTVIDERDNRVLGVWSRGSVHFESGVSAPQRQPIAVPGYPLLIQVNWPPDRGSRQYLHAPPLRWIWETGTMLLLATAAAGISLLFRQRERDAKRLRRLSEFNTMAAQVSQLIATADKDDELLQDICTLSIQYGHLKLVWVGRPDEQKRVHSLAASGAVSYLDGLSVSVDPDLAEGQGPAGQAWQDGQAHYYQSCTESPLLAPWHDRTRQLGLRACAAHPIFRAGRIWAIFNVYHGHAQVWDDEVKHLLEELAQNISRGLDRIDARARERQLEHQLQLSQDYQRALFEKNAAGLFLVDRNRIIQDINASLSEITGYSAAELIGQSTALLHVDHAAFDAFAQEHQSLLQGKPRIHETLNLRRKNGTVIIVQILGSTVTLTTGDVGILWSIVDVTLQQQAQEHILYQALHDSLTQLPNRRALDEFLPKAIARAQRQGSILAVGMLDLDDFKPVNDNWGHEAGDLLLQQFATRLQSLIRDSDLLIRLGGDEFVVVLENLEEGQTITQLQVALERLHQAVESPFHLGADVRAEVGMTLGVALFPFDAKDGDSLIRLADAAMYQAKEHKHDRQQWWRHGVARVEQPEQENRFDAYGVEAAALLDKAHPYLQHVLEHFVESFYEELGKEAAPNAILQTLTATEMERLKQRQRAHLHFLLDAQTTQKMIRAHARHVGEVHVLVGVRPILLTQGIGLYRRLLNEHLSQALLPARERYRILMTTETRLQDDLQVELHVEDVVLTAYFRLTSTPLPPQGIPWDDASAADIAQMGVLPGIQAALLLHLMPNGALSVISSAGPKAGEIAALFGQPGFEPLIKPSLPQGQGLCAQAWRSRQILSSATLVQDVHYQAWHETPLIRWARSALSVPIVNTHGQCEAVVTLFGAYPSQFESQVMQQFAHGLKQRWEQIWIRCGSRPPAIAEEQAEALRQRLFNNGLQMQAQPIIDLRTGRLVSVEMLARLLPADGEILSPGFFLPLLSEAELNRLFCIGLNIALAQLVSWDAQGLHIDVSINLPPCALLDEESPKWVQEALLKHNVTPQRLTLELLETQEIDLVQRNEVIGQFLKIGTQLAIDDLGSGYSSLQRLSSIPFQTIKIDQGLLVQIRDKPIQIISLISSLIQMGRDLNLSVIVEGVEDPGMIEMAIILGAHYGQGYALAKPMAADELITWHQHFTMPIQVGGIQTFLGALTYHWWFMHHEHHEHPTQEADCPITNFLVAQGLQGCEVSDWHTQVHADPSHLHASEQLTGYLIDRIRGNAT